MGVTAGRRRVAKEKKAKAAALLPKPVADVPEAQEPAAEVTETPEPSAPEAKAPEVKKEAPKKGK